MSTIIVFVLLCTLSYAMGAENISATVPRIIHQTWKTHTAPEKWRIAQESWPRLHPDWEYHLWSDQDNEDFIRKEFPAYLSMFQSYVHPIERADAVRYFLLYKYGGLYVDLDMEAVKPFDELIENRTVALARSANTGKFTNNLMISRKGEPYWKFVFDELQRRANRTGFITSEVEILETTGPRLMQAAAAMWSEEGNVPPVEGIESRLVHPCGRCEPVPCTKPGAYIRLWEGNSWHDTISTIGMFFDCHLMEVLFSAFGAILLLAGGWRYRRWLLADDYRRREIARSSKTARIVMICCCVNPGTDTDPSGYQRQSNKEFDEDDGLMNL